MNSVKKLLVVTIGCVGITWAGASIGATGITKETAIEKALAEHPGEVQKAYMEKKKGKDVWEVKIDGDDGKRWELYYDVATGELVKTKSE